MPARHLHFSLVPTSELFSRNASTALVAPAAVPRLEPFGPKSRPFTHPHICHELGTFFAMRNHQTGTRSRLACGIGSTVIYPGATSMAWGANLAPSSFVACTAAVDRRVGRSTRNRERYRQPRMRSLSKRAFCPSVEPLPVDTSREGRQQ